MITFDRNGYRFNYRIAGVTIHRGRVLLHRMATDDFWALPGGRGELYETSRETAVREYLEETGQTVSVGKTLWIVENYFEHENAHFHELSFIYQVDFAPDSPCLQQEVFFGKESEHQIVFQWFSLEQASELELYPLFLRHRLHELPDQIEHIVHSDNRNSVKQQLDTRT